MNPHCQKNFKTYNYNNVSSIHYVIVKTGSEGFDASSFDLEHTHLIVVLFSTFDITHACILEFMLSVSFLLKLLSNYDQQIFVVQCDTISEILVLLTIMRRSNLVFAWYFFTCKKLKLFCTWCLDGCLFFVFHMLFFCSLP